MKFVKANHKFLIGRGIEHSNYEKFQQKFIYIFKTHNAIRFIERLGVIRF